MRKPVGLFVAAFATIAGGAAAAQVGDSSTSTTESTTSTSESTTTTETTETTATTEPTTTTIEVEESTEADALVEGDGGEHGAWVSDHARNICNDPATVNPETGEAFRNHGECVSFAARDKDHDGTPDVPAEETETETETEEPEVEDGEPGAGHRTSGGAGHRDDSPGRGHARHGG